MKIGGKCCSLIVDGGSSENIVSREFIEKLKLNCEPHPQAYRVSRLRKGQHVTIYKQFLINFKIGNYHDNVLCDLVPMDAFRLLLGRPWKYDRKIVYDGVMCNVPDPPID